MGEGGHHHPQRKWLLWQQEEQLLAVFEFHKDQSVRHWGIFLKKCLEWMQKKNSMTVIATFLKKKQLESLQSYFNSLLYSSGLHHSETLQKHHPNKR